MMIRTDIALLVALAACAACGGDAGPIQDDSWPAVESPVPVDPSVESRVDDLLARMTEEEKVGQIIQADVRRVSAEDVRDYNLGSVLNGGGGFPNEEKYSTVQDWLDLADMVYDASVDTSDGGVGIPIIWGVDAVHGHNNVIGATLFPHNVGLGAANDPDLLRRIGEVTAREVRVTGHDWNFGPTVAVPRDGRWGRAYEGYSEDPEIVTAYARAMVRGLQGEPGAPDFLDEHHVIATAKHFIADGGTDGGKDQGDALISSTEMRHIHGPPYVAALEAGVQSVMVSFSSWNGLKMHANRDLLTGVLKETMGFDGLLVGDWNAHGQIPGCTNASCAATINAGLDMFMAPDDWRELYDNTLAQLQAGEIPMERLDDAVRRILRVKIRAGVLDRGRPSSRAYAADESVLGAPEHRSVGREAVRKSLVLLKNDDSTLPLDPRGTILVTGDGADDIGKQSGGWTLSWQGTGNTNDDFPGATSIWDGIREAVEAAGGSPVLSTDGRIDPTRRPDAAVVVFGEDPYAEFQGDRENVDYPRSGTSELDIMRSLAADGVPVVAVFITGRPLWVNPELNASDAFVVAWLPGTEGIGVADVLLADVQGEVEFDFTGRLSFSWPRTPDQAVLNRDDADYDPLFPYGYGRSVRDDADVPDLPEGLGSAGDEQPPTFFAGGPVAPWRLMIRGPDGDEIEAATGRTPSAAEDVIVTVLDRRVQEDARTAQWSVEEGGRVFLSGITGIDLTPFASNGYALAFDVLVESTPPGPVHFVMAHAEASAWVETRADITGLLTGAPTGAWSSLRLNLSCLGEAGVDLTDVTMPWGLEAPEASISFSDIRLVPSDDGPATCVPE